MRILVQSPIDYLLKKALPDGLLGLPKGEATERVEHEINYLNPVGYGASTAFCGGKVKMMRDGAPQDKKAIYDATLRALARMARANSPSGHRDRELRRLKEERQRAAMRNLTLERIEKQFGRRGGKQPPR